MYSLLLYVYCFFYCKLAEGCAFNLGDVEGGYEKQIGVTDTADECENMVKTKEPTAKGATWGDPGRMMGTKDNRHGHCFAEFGNIHIVSHLYWRGCVFEGTFLSTFNACLGLPNFLIF